MPPFAVLIALAVPAAHAEDTLYDYRGPFPEGQYTAAQIGGFLRAKPNEVHEVRLKSGGDWRPARYVSEIAAAWLADPVTGVANPSAPEPTEADPIESEPQVKPSASGDRGAAPPRNAPPAAETVASPRLRGIGELWAGIAFPLGDAGGDPSLTLRRLAGGAEYSGAVVSSRLYLRVDAAESATLHIEDAWIKAESPGPIGGFGRIGVARPGFGTMDRFEASRRYWVPGASADLERTAGWMPEATLGLGGGFTTPRVGFVAELADATDGGEGAAPLAAVNLDAVEARARLQGALGGSGSAAPVHLGASVAYRVPGLGTSDPRLLGGVHVEVTVPRLNVLLEGLAGSEGKPSDQLPFLGGLAALSTDVPVEGEVVDHLSFVVTALAWDGTVTGLAEEKDIPDAMYLGRAAANITWETPHSDLITGLGYQVTVPQDLAVPVSQALVLEAAWRY